MTEKEIWIPIKNYEELYAVSNLGKVKSIEKYIVDNKGLRFQKQRLLKNSNDNLGYKRVSLCKNGKVKSFLVHRLVAEAFLDKNNFKSMPEEDRTKINLIKLEVNHKDENPNNCKAYNLEYCTHLYNNNYGNRKIKTRNNLKKEINQYSKDGNFIKRYEAIIDVEKELKISNSNVSKCCKGKRKTAGGYIWRYANE